MNHLEILLLADNRPGHYHLSEGVIAALARLSDVKVTRIDIKRRRWMPGRLLARMINNNISASTILRLAYGLAPSALPKADLVISAGGNTLAANIAASRLLASDNIFIGSLRRFSPHDFSLVITSYQSLANQPNHLMIPKPSTMDPDKLGRPKKVPHYGAKNPPKLAGLLLGGDTPDHKFQPHEWQKILDVIEQTHAQWGTRWLVSNSRRTPDSVSDLIAKTATQSRAIKQFTDVRSEGSGTLKDVFTASDIILCSDDSSSMISEAISARLPVIGLSPQISGFTKNETEYRRFLQDNDWTQTVPIAELDLTSLDAALAEIRPMEQNHLESLAQILNQRLPQLFD